MKKILIAGAAIAALTLGACSNSGAKAVSAADKAFADSLSRSIGEFNGAQVLNEYNRLPADVKPDYDKAEMLRGIKTMIMSDTAKLSYVTGLQIGMQLWSQLSQMEKNGIAVDRKAVYEAYAKAFQADSAGNLMEMGRQNQELMMRAQSIMQAEMERKAEAERQAKLNSPEVKKNVEEGEAYLNKVGAEEGVETTESGLRFKTVKAGSGATVGVRDRAKVKYTGTLPDGTVFDSNDDATFSPMQVVPGFREGLLKMQKGGVYHIAMPADLAYGIDGTPDGSVGPMQPLTFDVEVLDVIPAPTSAQMPR